MARKLQRAAAAVLVLAAAATTPDSSLVPHAVADAACATLANKDSAFMSALVTMNVVTEADLDELAAADVFARADATMPWLTTCAAAIDPIALMTQVMTSSTLSSCMAALNASATTLADDMTESGFKDTLCPLYNNTVIPCVADGLVDIAVRAMDASGGCCDALTAKIKSWTGNDLKTTVTLLLQHVGNVLCAQKTVAATGATQYCGLSLMAAISSGSSATSSSTSSGTSLLTLLNLLQIPNTQVCSALSGSAFTTTLGVSATLPIASSSDIGICFRPIDLLLQHVRDYPLVKSYAMVKDDGTSVPLSNLFAADKCMQGDVIVEWLARASNPTMIVFAIIDAFIQTLSSSESSSPSNLTASDSASMSASSSAPSSVSAATASSSSSAMDSWGSSSNLTTGFLSLLHSLKSTAKALCFHLPNSATCAYSGQTIKYPYTAVVPSVANAATSSALAAVTSSASTALLLAVLASTLAIAISTFAFDAPAGSVPALPSS